MHVTTTVLVENEKGRHALFARAESALRQGECLVRIVDVVGLRRGVRTTPTSPRATLVASEVPVVLRGGLTSLVSYWVVPADELGARETHTLHGKETHAYDVTLSVARMGTRPVAEKREPVVA
jgi:Tfp pilus assembly protein PilX